MDPHALLQLLRRRPLRIRDDDNLPLMPLSSNGGDPSVLHLQYLSKNKQDRAIVPHDQLTFFLLLFIIHFEAVA